MLLASGPVAGESRVAGEQLRHASTVAAAAPTKNSGPEPRALRRTGKVRLDGSAAPDGQADWTGQRIPAAAVQGSMSARRAARAENRPPGQAPEPTEQLRTDGRAGQWRAVVQERIAKALGQEAVGQHLVADDGAWPREA
jgi:hypothetical protein